MYVLSWVLQLGDGINFKGACFVLANLLYSMTPGSYTISINNSNLGHWTQEYKGGFRARIWLTFFFIRIYFFLGKGVKHFLIKVEVKIFGCAASYSSALRVVLSSRPFAISKIVLGETQWYTSCNVQWPLEYLSYWFPRSCQKSHYCQHSGTQKPISGSTF